MLSARGAPGFGGSGGVNLAGLGFPRAVSVGGVGGMGGPRSLHGDGVGREGWSAGSLNPELFLPEFVGSSVADDDGAESASGSTYSGGGGGIGGGVGGGGGGGGGQLRLRPDVTPFSPGQVAAGMRGGGGVGGDTAHWSSSVPGSSRPDWSAPPSVVNSDSVVPQTFSAPSPVVSLADLGSHTMPMPYAPTISPLHSQDQWGNAPGLPASPARPQSSESLTDFTHIASRGVGGGARLPLHDQWSDRGGDVVVAPAASGVLPALGAVVGRQTYDDEDDRFYDALLAEEDVASDELLSGVLRNGMDF
jgi:hypothetical protein